MTKPEPKMITIPLDAIEEECLVNLRLAVMPMHQQVRKLEKEVDERIERIKRLVQSKQHRFARTMGPIAERHELPSIPESYVEEKDRDESGRRLITFVDPRPEELPPTETPAATDPPKAPPAAKKAKKKAKRSKKAKKKATKRKAKAA